jgi:hypothetical protein
MVSLVILLVLAIGAAAFLGFTSSDLYLTRREAEGTRAFYVAQAGTEKAVAELKVLYSKGKGHTTEELESITAPHYDGFTFDEFTVAADGPACEGTLEHGKFRGLHGRVQKIRITAAVSSQDFPELKVRLRQEVEAQFIGVFQFAIFYNSDDLEILPGKPMTILGPVHCNYDMYTAAEESGSLSFDSIVTCVGDIFHRRKDDDRDLLGTVQVRDGDGVYREMLNPDGTWLDSEHPDWLVESQTRWDGKVASAAHQVSALQLPLATPERPRDLVAQGQPDDTPEIQAMKYYYRADLSIIDGVAYDKHGYSVDLRYYQVDEDGDEILVNPVSRKEFYNFREGTTVSVTEVDIAKLVESGKSPANGILYVSDQRSGASKQDAVRLVNGEELPAQGLTVATDRPLYIWGDYNTVDKRPASVVCDAINILSNNWKDDRSQKQLWYRVASNTEVNAAIIAGNTVTQVGQYNGGVENMPRFLEDWSGKTLTYRGSLVAAWQSYIATGNWVYGGNYYTAPNRNWAYDFDLSNPAKAPPGEPHVYTVAVAHWRYDWWHE